MGDVVETVGGAADRWLLVIGDTPVARRVCATLRASLDEHVRHLIRPGDAELALAVEGVRAAAVLIHDDVAVLRYALALAHLRPELSLTVTIFDRTMAEELRRLLPQAHVVSPAAMSVPSIVGACLGDGLLACFAVDEGCVEIRRSASGDELEEHRKPMRSHQLLSVLAMMRLDPRHHDPGTRILLLGLLGLLAILVADWTWLFITGHDALESLLDASRVVATVGPGAGDVGHAYALFASFAMLLTVVLTALFTAGLVDRLLEPRLLNLLGPRALPRRHHVVVVGIGQVGLRLCAELKAQGIPVVGVERDRHAPLVDLARQLGIPVVIGDGSARSLLERVRICDSLALAAVGSSDLDNIAVAVTASAVSPRTRVVLRAGEQDAVAETRSLLPLGVVRDVTRIATSLVLSSILGHQPRSVVADDDTVIVVLDGGRLEAHEVYHQELCHHHAPEGRPS